MPVPAPSQDWKSRVLPPVILVLVGLLAYGNSFSGEFYLDDIAHILKNESIRNLSDLDAVLGGSRRPFVNLSLALNHHFADPTTDPPFWPESYGFHLFNLVVHLMAGLTLFGIIHRVLLLVDHPFRKQARGIAFAAALLWVVHPLNTQAVSYVIQRGESLMGLFYLLALYGFIRSGGSRHPPVWMVCSVTAAALGRLCKAVMVSVPLTILLFDRCFVAKSFAVALRRRGLYYALLGATWLLLVWPTGVVTGVLNPSHTGPATVGFAFKEISPLEYFLTQGGVILNYLHLSLWPADLVLDYGWPVARTIGDILPGLFIVSLLGLFTLWLLFKHPGIGFIGAWFFLILAPTSSIVPIRDIAFEHRMYLPLISITTLATLGGAAMLFRLVKRGTLQPSSIRPLSVILMLISGVTLGARTHARNDDYASGIRMWESVVRARPQNLRGWAHLAAHHIKAGASHKDETLSILHQALTVIQDDDPHLDKKVVATLHTHLSFIYRQTGDKERARHHYLEAIRYDPEDRLAHKMLGLLYEESGEFNEAARSYQTAVRLDPKNADIHYRLGLVLSRLGPIEDAIASFQNALSLKPDMSAARDGLESLLRQRDASAP